MSRVTPSVIHIQYKPYTVAFSANFHVSIGSYRRYRFTLASSVQLASHDSGRTVKTALTVATLVPNQSSQLIHLVECVYIPHQDRGNRQLVSPLAKCSNT